MSSNDANRKEIVMKYLREKGIKANSKGYKALFYAILEASHYPDKSCSELFDAAALELSSEGLKKIDGKTAYRNAHYAIKNTRNGSYDGGPYDFIKSCSIGLESM